MTPLIRRVLAFLLIVHVSSTLGARPLRAVIDVEGQEVSVTWFLVRVTPENYIGSPNESGQPEISYGVKSVKNVRFDDPPGWVEATTWFRQEDYARAIPALKQLAATYASLALHRGSPGAMAQFYLQEALRRSGRLEELAASLRAAQPPPALDEATAQQAELHHLWALAAEKNWSALQAKIHRDHETLRTSGVGVGSAPPLKPGAASLHAQVFFLRGAASEALGQFAAALDDYYRAVTLDGGTDKDLRRRSLDAALALQMAAEAKEPDPNRAKEIIALKKLRAATLEASQ
jgi:tetratricopeptide (TPR) repeat protein